MCQARSAGARCDHGIAINGLLERIEAVRQEMFAAAESLQFETAARLRDELKRLQAVSLTIADDPFARQSDVARAALDAELTVSDDGTPSTALAPPKSGRQRA